MAKKKLEPMVWCPTHKKMDSCFAPQSICTGCGMYNGAHSMMCGYSDTEIHRKLDKILALLEKKLD